MPTANQVARPTNLPSVPGYEIVSELGRGGMGVVYQARQVRLKRSVALKTLLAGALAGPHEMARFRAEAEAVARLQHPNIVQIYEIGEHNGLPYFSLEYIRGGNLAHRLTRGALPFRQAAELVETLARAVHFAHQHQVIHRDLKPANILLETGESAGAGLGVAKITDFGLAKQLDSSLAQTKTEAVLGTPSYMAPEQAMSKNKQVGPAADIYALGAILYECLTGRPPFRGDTALETMLQAASQEVLAPHRLQSTVPRDLDTICVKCLEKEPQRRYASAADLADDLRRFLDGTPIKARPVGPLVRLVKWVKRRPGLAAALALVVILPLLAGTLVWRWRDRERPAPESSAAAPQQDGEKRDHYLRLIAQCAQEQQAGNYERASHILDDCPVELRGWEWHYLQRLCNWGVRRTFVAAPSGLRQLAYSRNGLLAVSSDGPGVRLWDPVSGQSRGTLGEANGPVNALAFSPDGQFLATGDDRTLRVYDVAKGKELVSRPQEGRISCLAYSPDGRWLATGGGDPEKPGNLWLWSAMPGDKPVHKLSGHKSRVASLAFSFDSHGLTSAGMDETLAWDVASGRYLAPLPGSPGQRPLFMPLVPQVALLTRSQPARVTTWDYQKQKPGPSWSDGLLAIGRLGGVYGNMESPVDQHQTDPRPGCWINDAAFSTDGKYLAMGGGWPAQGKVRLLRGDNLQSSMLLFGHAQPVSSVSFAADGQALASGSRDGTVRIWDPKVRRFDFPLESRGPQGATRAMAFSADGQRLATLEDDPKVAAAVWDLHTGQRVSCPRLTPAALQSVHFSADGSRVAAVSGNGERTVCIWRSATGEKVAQFADHPVSMGELHSGPNGFRLASILPSDPIPKFLDKPLPGVRIIDPQTGQTLRTVGEPSFWQPVPEPTFSPDGRRLAAVSKEGNLTLWDVSTGRVLLSQPAKRGARFAADGRYLISEAPGKNADIWDATTGKPAGLRLPGQPWQTLAQFSRDGRVLALPLQGGSVLIWDAVAGQALATIRGHGTPVAGLVFSSDAQRLFTASAEDTNVRVWDTASGTEALSLRPARGVHHLWLSGDGRNLAAGSNIGIMVWNATPVPDTSLGRKTP